MIFISKVSHPGYWSEAARVAPGKGDGGGELSQGEGHVQEVQGGDKGEKDEEHKRSK